MGTGSGQDQGPVRLVETIFPPQVLVHSSSTQIENSPGKQRKPTVKIFREGHFSDSADCGRYRQSSLCTDVIVIMQLEYSTKTLRVEGSSYFFEAFFVYHPPRSALFGVSTAKSGASSVKKSRP